MNVLRSCRQLSSKSWAAIVSLGRAIALDIAEDRKRERERYRAHSHDNFHERSKEQRRHRDRKQQKTNFMGEGS